MVLMRVFVAGLLIGAPKLVAGCVALVITIGIDAIVRQVRFDGWQTTTQGEREVQQALRRSLLKYRLHTDHPPF